MNKENDFTFTPNPMTKVLVKSNHKYDIFTGERNNLHCSLKQCTNCYLNYINL